MLNKFILIFILLATAIFISGCISDRDGGKVNTSESAVIPKTNLPAGFTYMGIHEITLEIGGSSINATEGVYRYGKDDIYIQVIKDDKPESLMSQYMSDLKEQYKSGFNPFMEISINGHNATQITDYSTIDGQQKPYYTAMWATDKYMILVGKSSDPKTAITLANATGI